MAMRRKYRERQNTVGKHEERIRLETRALGGIVLSHQRPIFAILRIGAFEPFGPAATALANFNS